jgi:hypothetical protein
MSSADSLPRRLFARLVVDRARKFR